MDIVLAVRAGKQPDHLRSVLSGLATVQPAVVHTASELELALGARERDLVVFEPAIVADSAVWAVLTGGAPPAVAWLDPRSPGRTVELLDAGLQDVVDVSMTEAEIGARLRSVARRGVGAVGSRPVAYGGLEVDARLRLASWEGTALTLSPREVEVLQVLVAAGGATVPRELIYRQVWRWSMPRGDRTVDVNVKRLRAKLAGAGVAAEILTQPGVGYRLAVSLPARAVTDLSPPVPAL